MSAALKGKISVVSERQNRSVEAELLGENATDGNRKKNFCMIRDGFYDIAALLDPFTASKHGSPNYHLLLSEKKPAIPLYNLRIPGRFG